MFRTSLAVLSLLLGIAILVALAVWAVPVRAQEHWHGDGHVPDWYDKACCDNKDCRPVADDEIEFLSHGTHGVFSGPMVRYKPTGNLFPQQLWRHSQDERYHVCINPLGNSLCFYDRTGA